jgi:hypothetical protein
MIMSPDLGLGSLLATLRQAGIRVGVAETARLQHVFSLPQDLSEDKATRLKSILRAVLAKDTDERETIDRVVDLWVGWAERELDFRGGPQHSVRVLRSQSKRRSWRAWSLATLLVLALAALLQPLPERRSPPPAPPPTLPEAPVSEPPASSLPEAQALSTRTFWSEVPVLEVIMPQPVWTGWPLLGLGALAAISAVGLWLALRKRRWLPEQSPLPERKGPPRVFLSPPTLLEPQLLEPRQQEALVWGISRFVAEEPTRRVDLPASVRATVHAGGLLQVRFQLARHFREVWLWLDDAVDDPALRRLADELELVLRTHGLPVERASFRGIPRLLVTPSGQVFAPGEIDELRDAALVAVLTDGRVLARQYTADDRRVVLDALLRGLSHWPHLVFVDFSAGDNDLAAILARHDLEVISPASLPEFLGTGSQPRAGAATSPTRSPGEEEAWAAAAALAPAPLQEATAFDLRRHLGLRISPWALRALQSEASGPPGLLWWSVPVRVQRLGWLSAAEQHVGGVAPGSLLARALDFWEGVYDRESRRRQEEGGASPWVGTPAQQHLLMEKELLRLWREPRKATRKLYELYRGALKEVIRKHLAHLAPAGRGEKNQAELPWRWEDRLDIEKVMLQEMGLGGELPAGILRRSGRMWFAIGICGGLALGALSLSTRSDWDLPPGVEGPSIGPPLNGGDKSSDVSLLLFQRDALVVQRGSKEELEEFIRSVELRDMTIFIQRREPIERLQEKSEDLEKFVQGAEPIDLISLLDYHKSDKPQDTPTTLLMIPEVNRLLIVMSNTDRSASQPILGGRFYYADDILLKGGSSILSGGLFYRVSVGNRFWVERRLVPQGARVRVRWRTEERPCVTLEKTAEIWRCGSRRNTLQPALQGIRRSIAILNPSPHPFGEARHLAMVLLDTGSADAVAFSSDWSRLELSPDLLT